MIKKPAGVLLIALGIPSLFLPILPGAVMILTGVVLLGEKKIRYKLKKRIEKSEGNSKQKNKKENEHEPENE